MALFITGSPAVDPALAQSVGVYFISFHSVFPSLLLRFKKRTLRSHEPLATRPTSGSEKSGKIGGGRTSECAEPRETAEFS